MKRTNKAKSKKQTLPPKAGSLPLV